MSIEDADDQSSWHVDALCRQFDPGAWHPEPGAGSLALMLEAKRICMQCPVQPRCLEEHLREEWGVYGGLDPRERRRLRGLAA